MLFKSLSVTKLVDINNGISKKKKKTYKKRKKQRKIKEEDMHEKEAKLVDINNENNK